MSILKMMRNRFLKTALRLKKRIILPLVFMLLSSFSFATENNLVEAYNQGLEYQNQDNWYLASQKFVEIINVNPAFTDAWLHLGECAYKLGEFDLALLYLAEAERYESARVDIQNLKGMIYLALGQIDDARNIFNEVLKKYPNDIDSHFGLAEIELYEGRFSGAENQYAEVLKRQNVNRKALLSLALVAAETGDFEKADTLIRQVTGYYSGDSDVMYLSAIVASMKGDYDNAERLSNLALELNENNEKAYELLSTVWFMQKKYEKVIDLCDFLISKNRNSDVGWYLKGLSYKQLGQVEDAIDIWSTGLSVQPQDELMRSIMEIDIRNNLKMDDDRRSEWAQYHIENAKLYASRYDNKGAFHEYQRALLLDPVNVKARIAYADLLEMNGMHELYLNQLKFIRNQHAENLNPKQLVELNDKIEAYDSLLNKTLSKQWDVDSFYLDKIRWNIAIFYKDQTKSFMHANSDRLVAEAASDIFSGVAITSVRTQVTPVTGYGEAFRKSRLNKFDYFIIISLSESKEDLTLNFDMYSARTGTLTTSGNFYSTGNNKFSTVLRRFRNAVLEQLTVKGTLIKRNGKNVLIDLGKAENIVEGAEFKIIKKGGLKTADSGPGLIYKDGDVLGTLVVTKCNEEISEGKITSQGFYDRINIGDEIVLVSQPETKVDNVVDTVPAADVNGTPVVENSVGEDVLTEIRKAVERPAILELLRNIY